MSLVMFILWIIERATKDASIVDVGWAYGLGFTALGYGYFANGDEIRRGLIAILAGAWSLRLGTYLLNNRVIGKSEDARYVELRDKWGRKAGRNFFLFFQFQALLVVAFSIPYWVVAEASWNNELRWQDYVGIGIWAVSVLGESIADRQLAQFREDPASKGKTCQRGLWRYSRHPNYFFEWLHWWGYVFIAWNAPYWGLSLLGPALMFYFLFKITGIPPTEARALKSRSDYKTYQERTSMFFPWFPKKIKGSEV